MTGESVYRLRTLGRVEVADRSGEILYGAAAQPKGLALLTYLAVVGGGHPVRRDRLLLLLWPELDDERARHALRQALLRLRNALGSEALPGPGDDTVTVDPARVVCDAVEFGTRVSEGRYEEALDLYEGSFLDGFHVSGAHDFEDWASGVRERLARQASRAAWARAEQGEATGDFRAARKWGRRAAALAPYNEERWRKWIALLARLGDRPGAVLAYREFARRLGEDLQLEPAPETRELVADLTAQVTPEPRSAALAVLLPRDGSEGGELGAFAQGLQEMLTTELVRCTALEVRPAAASVDPATGHGPGWLAAELDVELLVVGSVTRNAERVRIALRLVQARPERYLWAETWTVDPADPIGAQDRVAREAADAVAARVQSWTPADSGGRTGDRLAHDHYLRGRYHLNKLTVESLHRASHHFEAAARIDPDDPEPRAGLAETLIGLAYLGARAPGELFPRARSEAERALALDPEAVEAHVVMGLHDLLYRRDLEGSERHIRRAFEVGPGSPYVHGARALHACAGERCDTARTAIRRARVLDPLSQPLANTQGWIHGGAQRWDEMIAVADAMLELEPGHPHGHWLRGTAHLMTGEVDRAIAELQRASDLARGCSLVLGALGHAFGVAGSRRDVAGVLRRLQHWESDNFVPSLAFAMVHAGTGDAEACRHRLRRSIEDRDAWIVFLPRWPYFRRMHHEAWFQDLYATLRPARASNRV